MKESQKKELSVVIQKITEEQKKYKYDYSIACLVHTFTCRCNITRVKLA